MVAVHHPKEPLVDSIYHLIEESSLVVFADFRGLSVGSTTELRKELRNVGAQLKVVKNTLTSRALTRMSIDVDQVVLQGPSAIVYTRGDAALVAKTLTKFKSGTEFFSLKGGLIDRRFISGKQVDYLASLPSREELIAKVLRSMNAPITGFVTVASGPIRGFVTCVDGIKKQQENS